MSNKPLAQSSDPDLRNSQTALLRAARKARELARQTGTQLIITYGGSVRHIAPGQLGVSEAGSVGDKNS